MRTPLRARLLTALAGDPDGTPAWVRALADGDDAEAEVMEGLERAALAGLGIADPYLIRED